MKVRHKNKFNKFLFLIVIICLMSFLKNNSSSSFAYKNTVSYSDDLEIYFLNVGQADSILIKHEDNSVLIDAGNNEDGEYIVDYLKNSIGLKDIDMVVGTHPHEDHIGGLDDIIRSFDIGNIYMPDAISTSKTFEEVMNIVEEKDYYITVPRIDSEIQLGNMLFKVLYTGVEESDLNNTSIVLKLIFGNTSYLFTGDATSSTEKIILNKDISADVLKVGHHGSKYSSTNEFLDKVNPRFAIIMAGRDNSYGHPTKETLNKLIKRDIEIYRTDLDGTIKITSDGNEIFIDSLDICLDGR